MIEPLWPEKLLRVSKVIKLFTDCVWVLDVKIILQKIIIIFSVEFKNTYLNLDNLANLLGFYYNKLWNTKQMIHFIYVVL